MPPVEDQMSGHLATVFSLHVVNENLNEAIIEDNDVKLIEFIKAYEELNKFIGMLGKIFQFVKLDVNSKLTTLGKLSGNNCENYITVNSMLHYESEQKHKPGSTAFLGLHRALEFIVNFLESLIAAKDEDSVSHICRQSYERTLAKFHAWMIRKAVDLASYTLPARRELIDRIKGSCSDYQLQEVANNVIKSGDMIYRISQKKYDELNLNSLL